MKRTERQEDEEESRVFICSPSKVTVARNQPLVDSAVLMLELPWRKAPTFGLFSDLRTSKLSLLTHQP